MLILDESGSASDVPIGERHMAFDLLNDKFKVPAVSTYCNCRLFQLPKLDQKHHLVKVFCFRSTFCFLKTLPRKQTKIKRNERILQHDYHEFHTTRVYFSRSL